MSGFLPGKHMAADSTEMSQSTRHQWIHHLSKLLRVFVSHHQTLSLAAQPSSIHNVHPCLSLAPQLARQWLQKYHVLAISGA